MSSPVEPDQGSGLDGLEALPALERGNLLLLSISLYLAGLGAYTLIYALTFPFSRQKFAILIIGSSITVYFLDSFLSRDVSKGYLSYVDKTLTLVLAVGSGTATVYFFIQYGDVTNRLLDYHFHEYVFSLILIVALLEASRRAYGMAFTGVAYIAFLYAIVGHVIPGKLGHPMYTFDRLLEVSVLDFSGLFGSIAVVGTTWVMIFILYAGIITEMGGLEPIFNFAKRISQRVESGTAQVSVVSSFIAGSITGSAAANTAITGSFTIPLMKDSGFRGETAAAIESTASTGGQILPPVMGASAFLMAEILGIPYADIVQIAVLPALLFYFTIVFSVASIADKQDIHPTEYFDIDQDLLANVGLVVSFIVLLVYLLYFRFDPFKSGVFAILAFLAGRVLVLGQKLYTESSRPEPEGRSSTTVLIRSGKRIIFAFVYGMRTVIPLMVILGVIAIIVQLITLTGINQIISQTMVDLGSTRILLLIMAALMSILFGMGMPTVAAYLLVSIFVVPGLTDFGVKPILGHFFVFYFAIISGLTPPIAIVVAVASRIAESDFMQSCWETLVIALPGFVLPFAFMYNPSLLIWSDDTLLLFPIILIGLVSVVMGVLGYVFEEVAGWERVLLVVLGGSCIFYPGMYVKVGLTIVCALLIMRHIGGRLPAVADFR